MAIQSPNSVFDTSAEAQRQRALKGGRPKGSRAKLATKFFETLYAAWEEQGESVIARAAFHDPMGFANMVARLMPQKIEVSTPTDGITDERLAQMIELADRMAALKAGAVIDATPIDATPNTVAPLLSNHEYQEAAEAAKAGGGGPNRLEPHRTENTAHAQRPDPADEPEPEHNKLVLNSTPATADSENATVAETLPYPIGRTTPLSGHEAERRNLAKLQDDIDPASLF